MILKGLGSIGIVFFAIASISCNKPKVISPENEHINGVSESGIFSDKNLKGEASQISEDVHIVIVKEVMNTNSYVYAKVVENGEEFWIATSKKELEIGGKYFFRDGLLQTNFESKEFDRVFDKIYLVSNLVSENHAQSSEGSKSETNKDDNNKYLGQPKVKLKDGSISIAELVGNKNKYEGKTVQLTGRCVKINTNILGRNWIHLKDGTLDSYDLVVTSDIVVPEGHVLTMKGSVILDKDFGAGYKYEILVENGEIVAD